MNETGYYVSFNIVKRYIKKTILLKNKRLLFLIYKEEILIDEYKKQCSKKL